MKRKISFRQYLCLILNQPQRQRPAQVWPTSADQSDLVFTSGSVDSIKVEHNARRFATFDPSAGDDVTMFAICYQRQTVDRFIVGHQHTANTRRFTTREIVNIDYGLPRFLDFSFRIHLEALTCKRTDTFWS